MAEYHFGGKWGALAGTPAPEPQPAVTELPRALRIEPGYGHLFVMTAEDRCVALLPFTDDTRAQAEALAEALLAAARRGTEGPQSDPAGSVGNRGAAG